MSCSLSHVPEHLHLAKKEVNNVFYLHEEIYRRCTLEEIHNPFQTISIVDLSVNRQGHQEDIISQKEDVLFNIKDSLPQKYIAEICVLRIIELNDLNSFDKEFVEAKGENVHKARIKLVHDPKECMYPHCEFRVWVDSEHIGYSNYNRTVKKLNKIRTQLKQCLAQMIIQREINQSSNT
jgi:hypothetical protein